MNGLNCDKSSADNCPFSLLEIKVAKVLTTPTCDVDSNSTEIHAEIHGVGKKGTQDFKLEMYDIPNASLVEFEKIDPPRTQQEPQGFQTQIEWEDTMKTQPSTQRVFKAYVRSCGKTGRTSITVKLHHTKQRPPYTCIHIPIDLDIDVK